MIADYLAEIGRIRSPGTVKHVAYMLGYWLEHVGQGASRHPRSSLCHSPGTSVVNV